MADREATGPSHTRLLYSVEEAALLLGIGRTYMFELVATGQVDSLKVGKRRKVTRAALDEFIERLAAREAAVANASEDGAPGRRTRQPH